jgi:hypothetical protein
MDANRRDQLIEEMAGHLRQWGLAAPGIAFLEANKPFTFLGGQFLLFVQPLLSTFVAPDITGEYAALLEDRDSVERLIHTLELNEALATEEDVPWT